MPPVQIVHGMIIVYAINMPWCGIVLAMHKSYHPTGIVYAMHFLCQSVGVCMAWLLL